MRHAYRPPPIVSPFLSGQLRRVSHPPQPLSGHEGRQSPSASRRSRTRGVGCPAIEAALQVMTSWRRWDGWHFAPPASPHLRTKGLDDERVTLCAGKRLKPSCAAGGSEARLDKSMRLMHYICKCIAALLVLCRGWWSGSPGESRGTDSLQTSSLLSPERTDWPCSILA